MILGRADRLVDFYRQITKKYFGTPWQVLGNILDLDVEIDHVESLDGIPEAEELLQACIQVLFDKLRFLFPVEVPRNHIYRYILLEEH